MKRSTQMPLGFPMRGATDGQAKTKETIIEEIRYAYDKGGQSYAQIALRFKRSKAFVRNAVRGISWMNVGGPIVSRPPGPLRGENHPRHALSDACRAKICKLAIEGVSRRELSESFGVSIPTVGRIIRDRQGKSRPHAKKTKAEIAEIRRAFHEDKVSRTELAKRTGLSYSHLCGLISGREREDAGGNISAPLRFPMCGDDHPNHKLSNADVGEVLRLKAIGVKQVEISQRFKVSQATVSLIVHNKVRKHADETERSTAPVKLAGPDHPVFVFVKGKGWVSKGRLSVERYAIYKALASVYPGGLSGPAMRTECGFGGWRKSLKMMAKDGDHAAVLHLPDATRGDTYRFVWPVD